jgi:glycosyltransferase involved in cell wall biosynthesis
MEGLSLVSVILPTYNRVELLRRAINSVLAQTYPDWELIIWDDGSTDTTGEIVRSYHDERIKYFFDKNHGVAHARNRAIEVSHGKYLAFLDSDDEWVDEKLAVQVDILNTHSQIEVLFSDFMDIIESTQEKYRAFEQYSSVMKLLDVEQVEHNLFIFKGGLLESLTVEDFIATDSVFIRRELLERIGPFNEELRNLEDFELWWRMGLAGLCFAYIDKVYLTRYKPSGSLSSPSISACENVIKGLDLCLQEALSKERKDLVPYLNGFYRNTWQNLIILFGSSRNKKGTLNAFFRSMEYGFNLASIRLLLEAALDRKILRK